MTDSSQPPVGVYLEIGSKRTFAGALEWPGWCRSGRSAEEALQALCEAGPRYAEVLRGTPLAFQAPAGPEALAVVERLAGGSGTDFGAPEGIPAADARPAGEDDLQRFLMLLRACWAALDAAVQAAAGAELRKGPRGGGRDLEGIERHVLGAEQGYMARISWKFARRADEPLPEERGRTREAVVQALTAAVRDGLPERGPRGGVIWPPRYFVRRTAWHVLDHVWEIEDRKV